MWENLEKDDLKARLIALNQNLIEYLNTIEEGNKIENDINTIKNNINVNNQKKANAIPIAEMAEKQRNKINIFEIILAVIIVIIQIAHIVFWITQEFKSYTENIKIEKTVKIVNIVVLIILLFIFFIFLIGYLEYREQTNREIDNEKLEEEIKSRILMIEEQEDLRNNILKLSELKNQKLECLENIKLKISTKSEELLENGFSSFPKKFAHPEIIKKFIEYINNMEAENLKEAIKEYKKEVQNKKQNALLEGNIKATLYVGGVLSKQLEQVENNQQETIKELNYIRENVKETKEDIESIKNDMTDFKAMKAIELKKLNDVQIEIQKSARENANELRQIKSNTEKRK